MQVLFFLRPYVLSPHRVAGCGTWCTCECRGGRTMITHDEYGWSRWGVVRSSVLPFPFMLKGYSQSLSPRKRGGSVIYLRFCEGRVGSLTQYKSTRAQVLGIAV